MTEHGEQEGVVPARALDFATDGFGVGMGLEDVEREPAQDSEVLGSVVLSRAVAILVEVDVEYPMELVLDAPVTARDLQQPLGGHVSGQQIVPHHRRVGGIAMQSSARCDAADRDDAGEAMDGRQAGVAHDCRLPRFAPAVAGRLELAGGRALSGASCPTTAL